MCVCAGEAGSPGKGRRCACVVKSGREGQAPGALGGVSANADWLDARKIAVRKEDWARKSTSGEDPGVLMTHTFAPEGGVHGAGCNVLLEMVESQ
eukprot:3069071-Pleurochrysis_carterae.AAC.4